jgi:hypothetical protein
VIRTLELGGVVIPLLAGVALEQTYEEIGGFAMLRMMSGAAVQQQHWTRISTRIGGSGIVPPGLATLDFSQAMTLKCIASRSVCSASNVIALPASRRADYAPIGHATLASGQHQPTAVSLVGNTATLTAVAGATGYLVLYWPQLSVVVTARPREQRDIASGRTSWELTAEEV